MQTTLLGLAIAFIIALVAALIGPYFIDWSRFRPQFEAEATRVIGLPVRVDGSIDARLLPVPSLRFRSVAVGARFDDSNATADQLDVEFSLGALMRGEWRADQLTISGLMLDAGLDERGRITWAARSGGFDLGALAIDRLNVRGALTLRDAASKRMVALDEVTFHGDVRPGSLRGEGSFAQSGARTPFRLAIGRPATGEGLRLHVNLDPGAQAVAVDLDGALTLDSAAPRFDGTLMVSRLAPRRSDAAAPSPPDRPSDRYSDRPWRIGGRIRADPTMARIEQLEASYGADDHALKFSGVAELRLGASPLLQAVLTARQLDADRMLARDGEPPPTPADVLAGLRELGASLPTPPLPVQIAISSDLITLGQRPIQNVGADLRGSPHEWIVDRLELRAPGATRVLLSGRAGGAGGAGPLAASASIEAGDAEGLLLWLRGATGSAARAPRPLSLKGDVVLSRGTVAIENLKAEFDGQAVTGRLALGGGEHAGRVDATLASERLDLDALARLVRETGLATGPPREARLVIDAAQAVLYGRPLKPFALSLALTPAMLSLERLTIGMDGGVAVEGHGTIDRAQASGSIALNGKAPSLARFADAVAPLSAEAGRRLAALPAAGGEARLGVTLSLARDRDDRAALRGVAEIDAPQIRGTIDVRLRPPLAAVVALDAEAVAQSGVALTATLAAARGDVLAALLGVDRLVAIGAAPAQFDASVEGVWRGAIKLTAKLSGETIDGSLEGGIEPWKDRPSAALELAVRKADFAPLFGAKGPQARPVTAALTSHLAIDGDRYLFDGLDVRSSGSRLRGKVSVTTGGAEPLIEGDIGADAIDLASALSVALGAAGQDSRQPLTPGWLTPWRGRVAVSAVRGVLAGVDMRPVSAVVRGEGASITVEQFSGGVGGGEAKAEMALRRVDGEAALNATLKLVDVDGAALRFGALAMPLGRVSMQATLAGGGRSASALLGALTGTGTVMIEAARIAGVDAAAFDAATRASDAGTITGEAALRAVVDGAMTGGALAIEAANIPFIVKDGVLRVASTVLTGAGARLVVAGGYDFAADQADVRADLSPTAPSPFAGRPEIQVTLFGPPEAPHRMVDVAALNSWLGMRAIDREMRRLESLERGEKPAPALSPAAPDQPAPPPSQIRAPPLPPPLEVRPAPGAARPARSQPPATVSPATRPPLVITPGRQSAPSTN